MKRSRVVLGIFVLGVLFLGSFVVFSYSYKSADSTEKEGLIAAVERVWQDVKSSASTRRKINRLPKQAVKNLPVPILLDISPHDIADTWGDARSNGRIHEGTDIFAPRGAYIVSPTKAVVTSIGYGINGGNYVYTANPGGERFYFAHLDEVAEGIKPGVELEAGDLIGFVGNTGNAVGASPHLHFGIYKRGATNPFPRLTEEFTTSERLSALKRILDDMKDEDKRLETARLIVDFHRPLIQEALGERIPIHESLAAAYLENRPAVTRNSRADLSLGSSGLQVRRLQQILIDQAVGPEAQNLALSGATGTFGPMTKRALIEFQKSVGITPASGYFGPATRVYMRTLGHTF